MFGLSFMSPERIWVLLVIPLIIAVYVWALFRKKRTGMRFTNTTLLAQVMPRQSAWRRHLAVALSLLSLIALIGAWARPNGVEMVPRERATVVLIIDISRSMEATDVAPSRLGAAKEAAIKFIKELPKQYNVAVVSLAGNTAVRQRPETDRSATERIINALTPQDSTSVGESIYSALSAMQQAPKGGDEKMAPGAIVLLSDGDNNAGRAPAQAAAEAAKNDIPIFSIAYGTENGYVDVDGERTRVPPNKELLESISQRTGGQMFSAESLDQLDRVYSSIGSEIGHVPVQKEVTALWAGYALAFAAVAALAAVSLGARWP
jgi:Ca-activated chloride channel family protein